MLQEVKIRKKTLLLLVIDWKRVLWWWMDQLLALVNILTSKDGDVDRDNNWSDDLRCMVMKKKAQNKRKIEKQIQY